MTIDHVGFTQCHKPSPNGRCMTGFPTVYIVLMGKLMRNHWFNGDFPIAFRQTHVSEKLKKMVDYDYHSVMEIYSDIFGIWICMI